jgi:hypothetical protein
MNKFSYTFLLSLTVILCPSQAADIEGDIDYFRNKAANDTVSKILNYTEGLDESGADSAFWYPYNAKECVYRKASYIETKVEVLTKDESNESPNSNNIKTYKTELVLDTNVREIKLNTWTPSTVKVGYVQHAGTYWGPNNYFLHLIANGIPMLESSKPRDLERTQAAWNLVFNRFCPGRKNNF